MSGPWPPAIRIILHYTVAAAAVAAATAGGLAAHKFLKTDPYVSSLLCATLFATWQGGAGPGLLAAGLSVFALEYVLIPLDPASVPGAHDAFRGLLFLITALFVVWVSVAQERTAASFKRARDDLRTAFSKLEKLNQSLHVENSERQRAEQAIREAERELQVTIDTIPVIAASYGRDGHPEFANQTWRTYTGLSPESLRGLFWGLAIHPDDLPRVEAAWRTHLPTGEPFQMEHRIRRVDGEYRWHLVHRVPFRNENGEVIKWYGIACDIEDQKRAERALRRSEAYLVEGQRLSNTGTFGWNINRDEHVWSKEMYRIMAFDETVKPTMGQILQRVHPDDRERVQEQIDRAMQGEQDYDFLHRLTMPDGTIKHVHIRAHRQDYGQGEMELVGALMDVTAAWQAQDALQIAQAELAHATRVTTLGQMSASLAHELNQPLAAVVTNAEAGKRWLSRPVPDIESALTSVDRILKAANRASEVIRGVRAFSKKAAPEMTQLDINEVAVEALALVRHEAQRHGVALQLDLGPNLPPVRGDRTQMQQVILNLVVNGIQAMATIDDRERVLTVRTEQQQPDQVLLTVEDVGVGIAPENAPRLFASFYTTKSDGLGIGLSICQTIVQDHGGRIWATSNAGPGMTFQFTVPVFADDR